MQSLTICRYAFILSAAAALLAACSGTQSPIGAPGAMQAAVAAVERSRNASGSYSELIYAGARYTNKVYMFTYPAGAFVESFFRRPDSLTGMCTGNGGNVYTVDAVSDDSSSVSMYAHGATQPTWTKNMDGYRARSCAVNPLTGNLAIYTQGSSGKDEIGITQKPEVAPFNTSCRTSMNRRIFSRTMEKGHFMRACSGKIASGGSRECA